MAKLGVTRRTLLHATLAAGATGAAGMFAAANRKVRAAEPKSITLGAFKITIFSDGHLNLPATMFAPKIAGTERTKALAQAGQVGDTIKSPLNVTLIETDEHKILVDVGSGPRFMDTAGRLSEALNGAGVDAHAITHVVYTHAHPDHVWGTVDDFDELSFPDAKYVISDNEWNFWMSNDVLTRLPTEQHGFAVGAQRNLRAAKNHLSTVKPGTELMPGLAVIDTSGHTPGHISLQVGDGKDSLVVLGDALTHPVISFQHPDWQPATDQDQDKAVATRKRLLDRLATDGSRLIGYHLPAPGFGRVAKRGTGFAFEPLA